MIWLWVLWVVITLALTAWAWLLGWLAGQAKGQQDVLNARPSPSLPDDPAQTEAPDA